MHRGPYSRLRLLLAFALFALLPHTPGAADERGDYDYLALVVSWSPTYCATPEGNGNREQCGGARRYAFVVHGLWPQYERGWPEYCPAATRYVPEATITGLRDIMPSKGLVIHEWRKHGTCSGLGMDGYFDTTRALFERIRIPARYIAPQAPITTTPQGLITDFLKTNAWLRPDMISLHCGSRRDTGRLVDLRVCFDRDLRPRACGSNEGRVCRAQTLVLPPVR